jgi:FkbM family methyltransferase
MSDFSALRSLRRLLRRKTDPLRLLARKAPPGLRLRTLVHVGAHLGQERHAYEALGYTDMLWIEGSARVHAQLAESLAAHVAERKAAGVSDLCHQTVCALLAAREGEELALREFSNDGMSSSIFGATAALRERWPAVRETGREERVRTRTLDGLLAEIGFGPVDLLVVDVQGAELLVLQGAERTLGQVKAVVSEVSSQPFYDGGVLFPQLQAFLQERGFEAMSAPRRHGDMLFVHPQRAGFGP